MQNFHYIYNEIFPKSVVRINQGGGVAAPIGSQVFGEILPYLEIQKDGETQEDIIQTVEVPNIIGLNIIEARKKLKEVELNININNETEELDKENTIIKEQIPNPGIKVNKNSNIYVEI